MKRILLPFALLLLAIFLCTSCLSSDEDELVYYQDTAISSFSLGTLNKYTKGTTKDGLRDSLYKTTVAGSNYKFYIDQKSYEIYNPDSLPVGTDVEHVICNISSKNGGIVTIRNVDSDTLKYYSSTDSLDFSVPREIRVYSSMVVDTTLYRKYIVRVNVHKEVGDSFKWNLKCTNNEIAVLEKVKAVGCNDKIYVFGVDSIVKKTKVFSCDGDNWKSHETTFDALSYSNVAAKGSYIYIRCSDGKLKRSADADTWEDVADVAFDRLVGATDKKLYAIAGNKMMVSEDDGKTWAEDKMEETSAALPTSDICFSTLPLKTDENSERLFVTGYNDSENTTVWSKIEEYAPNSETHSWIHYDREKNNSYVLPSLGSMNVLAYDDVLVAMGNPYSKIYASKDNGLTWHSSDLYVYPDDFDTEAVSIATIVDSSKHLWIISGGTGQVWCGRLNRLAWEK